LSVEMSDTESGMRPESHINPTVECRRINLMLWNLPSSGVLHSLGWQLVTDGSIQSIGPMFKGQATSFDLQFLLNCLILGNGTDRLFRNGCNWLST
jgi:hypothetical protein